MTIDLPLLFFVKVNSFWMLNLEIRKYFKIQTYWSAKFDLIENESRGATNKDLFIFR